MTHFAHFPPGTLVYVLNDKTDANIVRSTPNTSAVPVAQLPPRAVAEVLGGPVYNDGHVFWQIRVPSANMEGWTSQGDGRTLYLRAVIEQVVCPGLPTSFLQLRDRAMVTPFPPGANTVRTGPGLGQGNPPVGEIPNRGQMDIEDGPACVDGIVWWLVKADNGVWGWTAEVQGSDRYLLPVEVGYK